MRLPTRQSANSTNYFARHFTWRRLAKYHLGLEFLRLAKQTEQAIEKISQALKIPQHRKRAQLLSSRYQIPRTARIAGGLDGAGFIVAFIAMGIGLVITRGDAPRLPPPAPAIVKVVEPTMPIQPKLEKVDPVFAETSGALAAEPVTISVDPASRLKLDYACAREECISRLEQSKAYQKLNKETAELQKEVDALRNNDPHGDLPGVSLRWIRTKSLLTGMIHSALSADPKVQRAERAMRAGGLIQPTFPIRSNTPMEERDTSTQAAAND